MTTLSDTLGPEDLAEVHRRCVEHYAGELAGTVPLVYRPAYQAALEESGPLLQRHVPERRALHPHAAAARLCLAASEDRAELEYGDAAAACRADMDTLVAFARAVAVRYRLLNARAQSGVVADGDYLGQLVATAYEGMGGWDSRATAAAHLLLAALAMEETSAPE